MGTEKRARQKANRAAKMAREAEAQKQESRRRSVVGFGVVIIAVAVIVGLIYLTRDDSKETTAPTTTVATSTTIAGREPTCPPVDGSPEPVLQFTGPPADCLTPGASYTATFDTTAGAIEVALDTEKTPKTTNNFVFLSRYHYYDDTKLFRVGASIDIVQGGSPHTQNNTDPGPGYNIDDEGGIDATGSHGDWTYSPGDLVMARSAGPNSAGAQFFFVTGPKGSNLDAQGTYVVFGHVTKGLDILEKIVETAKVDATGEGEPDPAVTVKKVTITETK